MRAMRKWPGVPLVYGWLQLDRRGQWLLKNHAGGFGRIANPALSAFIGRNYACDDQGRWFFQNGPQRVFASLHYTPWVYRLDDRGEALVAHTGRTMTRLSALHLDEQGALLAVDDFGPGVLLDRDLAALLHCLQQENRGIDEEALLELAGNGRANEVTLFGARVPFSGIRSTEVASRFRFVARPAPPAGEPDC